MHECLSEVETVQLDVAIDITTTAKLYLIVNYLYINVCFGGPALCCSMLDCHLQC